MQMEDEAAQLRMHIPTQEKELRQMLSDLSMRLTPAADALVTVFQQACYKIASNPFTLAADVQIRSMSSVRPFWVQHSCPSICCYAWAASRMG